MSCELTPTAEEVETIGVLEKWILPSLVVLFLVVGFTVILIYATIPGEQTTHFIGSTIPK